MITLDEIMETNRMITENKLDVRTITMGISLRDCAHPNIDKFCDNVYEKITHAAEFLVKTGEDILDVVDRVADVVGQVHDLSFQATAPAGGALTHPVEDLPVGLVAAVLACAAALRTARPLTPGPRVLGDGVQAGAREVDAHGPSRAVQSLGLQTGQDAKSLGVAFEAADGLGDDIESLLTIVPVGRVPQVVGQASGGDDVGVAAQGLSECAPHLGDLQGVGQTGAREVIAGRPQNLRLGAKTPQSGGVEDASPIAFEGGALRILRGFGHETGDVRTPVASVLVRSAAPPARGPEGVADITRVETANRRLVVGHGHKVSQQRVRMTTHVCDCPVHP